MNTPFKWLFGIFCLVLLVLVFLSFGNQQWGKWIYVWQYQVYPQKVSEMPEFYSGIWRSWIPMNDLSYFNDNHLNENGENKLCYLEQVYLQGKLVNSKAYFPNGQLAMFVDVEKEDIKMFDKSGKLYYWRIMSDENDTVIYDPKNGVDQRDKFKQNSEGSVLK